MKSSQLKAILDHNPKLSVSALRIFLFIAEAGDKGVEQADVHRHLGMAKATCSRQIAILCETTHEGTNGMALVIKRTSDVNYSANHLRLSPMGERLYDMTL